MLPAAGTIAPTDLLRYLAREQVTVVDLTPAYWHHMLAITEPDDERLRSVRLMITGGDTANPADCRAALRAARGARLLNAYGLTETTITSTLFEVRGERVTAEPSASVPVGRPLRHAQVLVLDENLNRLAPARWARSTSAAAASPAATSASQNLRPSCSCRTGTASCPGAGCTAPEISGAGVRTAIWRSSAGRTGS